MAHDARRILVIDYLRGLAALSVAWFHMTNGYPGDWVRSTGTYGWLGAEVFFVLSGFVIPYSISRIYASYSLRDYPSFLLRRVVRLEPPYVLSIVLVVALGYLSALAPGFRGGPPTFSTAQIASHLLYAVPFTRFDWVQPVYWTLFYEFMFYLLMGLLFPLIFGSRTLFFLTIFAVALNLAVLAGVMEGIGLLFLFGIALFSYLERQPDNGGLWQLIIVLLSCLVMVSTNQGALAVVGLATAAAIYFGRSLDIQGVFGRLLLGLGTISYSLYLIHVPIGGRVINLGGRIIEGTWQEFLLAVVALAVSIVAALLVWRFIELPAIGFARRVDRRRADAAIQPQAANRCP